MLKRYAPQQVAKVVRQYAESEFPTHDHPLEILEAGCGRKWDVDLGDVPHRLTGVDLDPAALEIRKTVNKDLDEGIYGNLATIDLPPESFHIIYSSFVLEHIEDLRPVFANFAKWLKPGGMIFIKVPDRATVHGLCTRFTPFFMHIWYHKLRGNKNAGKPGFAPYPTFYNELLTQENFANVCQQHHWDLKEIAGFGKYLVWELPVVYTCGLLSMGSLATGHRHLFFVAQNPRSQK